MAHTRQPMPDSGLGETLRKHHQEQESFDFALVSPRKREFFIDNLLVRIHLIIEMILVDLGV